MDRTQIVGKSKSSSITRSNNDNLPVETILEIWDNELEAARGLSGGTWPRVSQNRESIGLQADFRRVRRPCKPSDCPGRTRDGIVHAGSVTSIDRHVSSLQLYLSSIPSVFRRLRL